MKEGLFNVVIECFHDEEYDEIVTKETVSYEKAVVIDKGIGINLGDNYFTQIVIVDN